MVALAAVAGFSVYFHVAPPRTVFCTFNVDPEAAYLLTSLAVFKGQPYVYVEHPGLPLALAGSVLLAPARLFFGTGEEFALAVLRHPDAFFVLAHALLVVGTLLSMWSLARWAVPRRHDAQGWLAGGVAASFFAVTPDAFFWPVYWSHNAPALPLGTPLLLAVLLASRRRRLPRLGGAFAQGVGAGTLAATQLYFLTWVLAPALAPLFLAALRGWPRRSALRVVAAVAAGAVAACASWSLLMIPALPRFMTFVGSLLMHQGPYGTGEHGITTWSRWAGNLALMAAQAPVLFLTLAVVLTLLGAAFLRPAGRAWRAGDRAAAAALTLQLLALLAVLGKHPGVTYLPSVAAMVPPLLGLVFTAWSRRGRRGAIACGVLAACMLAGLAVNLSRAVSAHHRRLQFRSAMQNAVSARLTRAAAEQGRRPLLLWGPLLPDAACYALWMGEQYTGAVLGREISALCPDEGLAWSNFLALPHGRGRDEAALLVTTEGSAALFPAFRALGPPELSSVRDPSGHRLAFYSVEVRDGRMRELVLPADHP